MSCKNCGAPIKQGATVCAACGSAIKTAGSGSAGKITPGISPNVGTQSVNEALTPEVRDQLDLAHVHAIQDPEKYGGWKTNTLWAFIIIALLFPVLALIPGIMGVVSSNEVQKAQGKLVLVVCAVFWVFWTLFLY